MRQLLTFTGLLLLTNSVASWLRMLDPLLALQSWSALIGKPIKIWVGSVLFYPFLELLYSWPAYLLGGLIYFLLSRYFEKLDKTRSILLGAAIAFTIYMSYAFSSGQSTIEPALRLSEQLLIYTLAGVFFGASYHQFVSQAIRR